MNLIINYRVPRPTEGAIKPGFRWLHSILELVQARSKQNFTVRYKFLGVQGGSEHIFINSVNKTSASLIKKGKSVELVLRERESIANRKGIKPRMIETERVIIKPDYHSGGLDLICSKILSTLDKENEYSNRGFTPIPVYLYSQNQDDPLEVTGGHITHVREDNQFWYLTLHNLREKTIHKNKVGYQKIQVGQFYIFGNDGSSARVNLNELGYYYKQM